MSYRISIRRDTAANWTANNPTLGQGELGYEYDTNKLKIGDGTSNWVNLDYFPELSGLPASSVLIYGKASEDIAAGSLVMFAGVQGGHILLANADQSAPGFIDEWVVGVAHEAILNNAFGYVTELGLVENIDTSSFAEGDLLWMDGTTPGALTNVKPSYPSHPILVAATLVSNASNGSVFVRITFGSDLGDIHDVDLSTAPTDGQVITYDTTTSTWKPASISIDNSTIDGTVIGGTTPAAGSFTNITVSGTVDGRDVAADGTKLDGIEAGATADQTAAEIRTLVEDATDSNVFTDADHTKLNGIEALADVTDTANVTAAGALMDSELTDIAAVKALNQGVASTDNPSFAGLTATTADINGGTIDGTVIGGTTAAAGAFSTLSASGEITANGGIALGDNDKATFGASDDLQIYHDGSNSIVADVGTGDLELRGTNLKLSSSTGSLNFIEGNSGGAWVKLKWNSLEKLATTATGVDVTGTVTADGLTVDGGPGSSLVTTLKGGASSQLIIQGDADNDGDSGELDAKLTFATDGSSSGWDIAVSNGSGGSTLQFLQNNNKHLQVSSGGDISFYEDTGTTAKLFWDASAEALGIGTTPALAGSVLSVEQGSGTHAIVANSNTSSAPSIYLRSIGGTATESHITFNDSTALLFTTTSTERARIDNSGNLLVGTTTSPSGSGGLVVNNGASIQGLTVGLGGGAVATNTAVGSSALVNNTTGLGNTANGFQALYSNTEGLNNTANGYQALRSNTTGNYNVANGYLALRNNTTGINNTANGYLALYSNTTGSNNVANGYEALRSNTTGGANVANGRAALYSNTTGENNTANGYQALRNNIIGINNVANGYQALYNNTSGSANTANGLQALYNNTSGIYNTATGYAALYSCTTGSGNVQLGAFTSAGANAPVFIVTTENDRIVMGSTAVTNAYVQVAWTVVSDARDKTDFAPVPHGLDFVTKLEPTAYRYKENRDDVEGHGPLRYGFKAQDVLALEGDNPVIVDADDPEKLRFNDQAMIAVLVNAIKDQQSIIETLTARIDALEAQ